MRFAAWQTARSLSVPDWGMLLFYSVLIPGLTWILIPIYLDYSPAERRRVRYLTFHPWRMFHPWRIE